MRFIQKNWGILLAVFLTVFALLPLFHTGFFPMHDDEQVARLFDLDRALHAGHIPPRIVPNLGYGYGYPFFNFYPPFAYYVAESFRLFGFSYIISIKLMIVTGFILGTIFMYLLSKEFFGKLGALVASVAYTYTPYHAVDVYVRGALAEFWSFVFIPAQFWAYFMLFKKQKFSYFLLAVLFNAGLILSHNLVALMSIPFLGSFLIYLLSQSKQRMQFAIQMVASALLSFTLTAYFAIPSFFEKKFTLIDILTQELANYSIHFVCPSQFWNSAWGYGASVISCQTDGLSFQVGKIQILLAVLSVVVFIYLSRFKKNVGMIVLFFILFLFSLFIQTQYSKFIWDMLQPLWYIQFPWRFLIFSSFTAAFLSGALFVLIFPIKYKLFAASILVGSIVFISFSYFQPEKYYLNVVDHNYVGEDIIRWKTSNLAYEYTPRGIATRKTQYDTTAINIAENEIKKESFTVVSGNMRLSHILDLPQKKSVTATVIEPGILSLNTYAFPGWKVLINGRQTEYSDANKLKLIYLTLPEGIYTITATFSDTLVRLVGNIVTITTIIFLVFVSFSESIKRLAFNPKKHVK